MRRRVAANYGQMRGNTKWLRGESRGGYRGKSEGQDSQNETKTDRKDQWQFVGGIGSHKPVFNDPRETNQNFTSQHFDGNKLWNGYEIMETKERYE